MLKLNKKLPDLPSQLVRAAMDDLEEVEKKPNVKIVMDQWFSYGDWDKDTGAYENVCKVCLAGSVMLNNTDESDLRLYWHTSTDVGSKRTQISPKDYTSDYDTYLKLSALDCFRCGMLDDGLYWMDLKPNKYIYEIEVTQYRVDPDQFKKDMEKVIQRLEDAGY